MPWNQIPSKHQIALRRTCKSFTSKQPQEYYKECVEQYLADIVKGILNDWIENAPIARHVEGDCNTLDKADVSKLV